MIRVSSHFDLGRDTTRIKDPRDAERQTATAAELLSRLFHDDPEQRYEIQVLADEVGMGKTFVALGAAYSLLAHMRSRDGVDEVEDLRGCCKKVLILTPQNSALFTKWHQEVSEFVKRCVAPEYAPKADKWFRSKQVTRLDELVHELNNGQEGVVVATTSVFGAKLKDYDLKRRFLLSALFRFWGNRFATEAREKLLKGAPDGWPKKPDQLRDLTEDERSRMYFAEDDLLGAFETIQKGSTDEEPSSVEKLLGVCRSIAAPFVRDREELFREVERGLVVVYREATGALLRKMLPLVVIDEAHNWKNGPSSGANGYFAFRDLIASKSRRALLLTATPFQLRPKEMLELLRVSDDLKPSPTLRASEERCERLRKHRESVISPVLRSSEAASREMMRAWTRVKLKGNGALEAAWREPQVEKARVALLAHAEELGVVDLSWVDRTVREAVIGLDPDVKGLVREALTLYAFNADLSSELGRLVMRHRRTTGHRRFGVGEGYGQTEQRRADGHMLHQANGIDVRGEGELPHYLLMRCVTEMQRVDEAKKNQKRTSLGSALTGCYSTLLTSAEGKAVKNALTQSPVGGAYLELLLELVSEEQDPKHPKVVAVIEQVMDKWRAGEKTLIFCFRTHTAERLRSLIDQRIRAELDVRRHACLGGAESLKSLRSRLTGRDRDLIDLALDRVLWSALWALSVPGTEQQIMPADLELLDADLERVAEAGLAHGVDLLDDRLDRVFLHRAIEYAVATRLQRRGVPTSWRKLIDQVASLDWVSRAYGTHGTGDDDEKAGDEAPASDERGVNTVYSRKDFQRGAVKELAEKLRERREAAQRTRSSVLDTYAHGPSLWLSKEPLGQFEAFIDDLPTKAKREQVIRSLHGHLWSLSTSDDGFLWEERRLVFQALRRALLRDSVLLRLLPDRSELEDARWGELLVDAFFSALRGQSESMAARVAVFLEDLRSASGSLLMPGDARHARYDATRLRDQNFVALVNGSTSAEQRARVFAGFNTPLLPEVLICTSVGQEGIDLHRHCRHVVHYDLAWNPAVVEQRTGRVDRIGSKTFRERERELIARAEPAQLEIGVPFLAGTYDERMYEELRVRAQTFEVLTGGDISSADGASASALDNAEGADEDASAEGQSAALHIQALPASMVGDLRVKLHVWFGS